MTRHRGIALIALIALGLPGLVLASSGSGDNVAHRMPILALQLAAVIVSARLVGTFFERYLKQPRVLGELVAGIIIGPRALGGMALPFAHGPLFPAIEAAIPVSPELYGFAALASIVLLFMAGLETDLPTFLRFSFAGAVIGVSGVVVSYLAGAGTAVLFLDGCNSFMDSRAMFLGAISTATSVGISARILSEKRKMSSPEGVTILAAAVIDDVLAIVILAIVGGITQLGAQGGGVQWGSIGLIAAKAFGFWLISTALGIVFATRITRTLKWFRSNEAIASVSLGLALLLAGLAEQAGLAMIIGAYVMGLSLSRTDVAHEIYERLRGVYALLVPVFFCVMGMMVDFSAMGGVIGFGMIYTVAVCLAKVLGCGLPALSIGFNMRGAFRIGAGMLPRGEVTLIIASVGLASGAIGPDVFGIALITLLIATIIAPPILNHSLDGGSGTRTQLKIDAALDQREIDLSFPSPELTHFMAGRIQRAFREAGFFAYRLPGDAPIYKICKDETWIDMHELGETLELRYKASDDSLVRIVLLEELVALKDLVSSMQNMESPDAMGADLVSALFTS